MTETVGAPARPLDRKRRAGPALAGRPGLRRALALALAPALAGCAVGPNFAPPAAPVADKYLESHNPAVKTDRQDYRDWWRVFHDPVLDRLIETAYEQNLSLLSAGTRVLQARAELGVAVGEFYPQQQQGYGVTTYNRPSHADEASSPQLQLEQFLAIAARPQGGVGARFLGQVPARRRIRRRRLSRLDREL